MTTVNTNIASLIAHHGLLRANTDLSTRLERLSTGLRINRASDDPTGLAKSDRLGAEIRGLSAAIDGAERGSTMIAAIDSQLAAVAEQLESIKTLVAEQGDASLLPPEDRQVEIDAAIDAIERIANTAEFGGRRLLDGSLDYVVSPWDTTRVAQLRVHQADLAAGTLSLSLKVTNAAERATLFAAANAGSFAGTTLNEPVTLELAGPKGVQTVSFAANTTMATMVTTINQFRDQTGIEAAVSVNNGVTVLDFHSVEYGSNQLIAVRRVGSLGNNWVTVGQVGAGPTDQDTGLDPRGTINGMPFVASGLHVFFAGAAVNLSAVLTENYATNTGLPAETLVVLRGGATFQVGPGSTSNDRISFGVPGALPARLGYSIGAGGVPFLLSMLRTGGPIAVGSGDPNDAVRVVESALSEISATRSRLGAIDQSHFQGAIGGLQSALEAASAGQSALRDTDVAEETAAMIRSQILSQTSISVLGAAGSSAEALLRLLQR